MSPNSGCKPQATRAAGGDEIMVVRPAGRQARGLSVTGGNEGIICTHFFGGFSL